MKIELTDNEIEAVAAIHKKMMEAIAEHNNFETEKYFHIVSVSIAFTISNLLSTLGLNKVEYYLNDLINIVKNAHSEIRKKSSYMIYEDGKKIKEGEFN